MNNLLCSVSKLGHFSDFHWIFYKISTNSYIITNDTELRNGVLGDLLEDGYEIVWDSAFTKDRAKEALGEQIQAFLDWYERDFPLDRKALRNPHPLTLETVPISFRKAAEFINQHHRHHIAPQGHKFSIGLSDGDKLIGAAIAGNPVARNLNDGFTLEITRCCIKSSIYKNGVTKLLSAVYQAAKAMGYKRLVTYTLEEESGVSLKACGFDLDGVSAGGSWDSPSRRRKDKAPTGPKKRWVRYI